MNVAQSSPQQFNCSLQKWLDTELHSNTDSVTSGKLNSEDSEEQRSTSSPTTTSSSMEVPNPGSYSPPPANKESLLKVSETGTKSYAMEDLLRGDAASMTEVIRQQKRKQPTPVHKYVLEDTMEMRSKKRPNEEFLAELSRTATDALTRALSKKAKIAESGLEDELKGLVREALETSLNYVSGSRSSLEFDNNDGRQQQQRRQKSNAEQMTEENLEKGSAKAPQQITASLKLSSYIPSPTEIMEAFNNNSPEGFSQSFSTYYEALCRMLKSQGSMHPCTFPTPFRPHKFSESNSPPKIDISKVESCMDFQKVTSTPPSIPEQFSQTEALALVVNRNRGSSLSPAYEHQHENMQPYENSMISCMPRKKRTKVTDTRLIPPKLPPQLPLTSMDGGNPFLLPELSRSKIGGTLPHMASPPSLPTSIDPAFMNDILKTLSMANGHNHPSCSIPSTRSSISLPDGRISQMDLIGNLLPPPPPPPPPPPLPSHHHLHHHLNDFCYDMPNAAAVTESNPIRRNRSIGVKRVTNTSSASNYGCDGRSFLSSGSTSDEATSALHPGPLSGIIPTTSTLTPVHLRKAKLMFFFTRYPNSNLLKAYFCDVKFQKNNTAQLVKWFSNFREFYYIQMEKYARVAISEGIRSPNELTVTVNSELYRTLALHYNRNQQIEIPEYFRVVVETTMREFFVALSTGKDSEQSWKKPIYKIIARMDQPVPDYFKDPNWMAQLADG
ncbi:prospero [Echinococcus multilocularis]|uniref:Prospero n=1 Tax=Echinococcus multilocularis TaxID=6211 RepID=A0A068Y4T4_ECHMU|nr:prospero [Echinococcus multilocularis]